MNLLKFKSTTVRAHAATQERTAHCRVLRYPGGKERVICYPTTSVDPQEASVEEECDSEYETWLHSRSKWLSPEATPAHIVTPPLTPVEREPEVQFEQFTFNWEDMKQQAAELAARVKQSYQVLHGCPWITPRPMYVLTTSHNMSFSSHHHLYTLQTRVPKSQEVSDELGRVLGSSALASKWNLSDMVDGVVAFKTRQQAEQYVHNMMAEDIGSMDVHICEFNPYELFRTVVGEAHGCVVAVGFEQPQQAGSSAHTALTAASDITPGAGMLGAISANTSTEGQDEAWVPAPHQLASSLRGGSEWEW